VASRAVISALFGGKSIALRHTGPASDVGVGVTTLTVEGVAVGDSESLALEVGMDNADGSGEVDGTAATGVGGAAVGSAVAAG